MTLKVARWALVAVGGLVVFLAIAASAGSRTETLRNLVVSTLSERLDSEVELSAFSVDAFPTVVVRGEGLVVRYRGRRDVPPLVSVRAFTIRGGLLGMLRRPRRFQAVALDGLHINIPPEGMGIDTGGTGPADSDTAPGPSPLIVDRLHSTDAELRIIPRRTGKQPRLFEIHRLEMESLGLGERMPFKAELTNPVPKGAIETNGTFGPWRRADPGATPIAGKFTFRQADLGTIKGIGGMLDSFGEFAGQLNRIAVKGETTTPDFRLDVAERPVPLRTRFDATVDGTDGDTYLNEVAATIGDTPLVAKGAIEGTPGTKGRTIKLDVQIENGRIEDLLRLSVRSEKPVMTGEMKLRTDFMLPAGEADVIDRLRLAGDFALATARFTDPEVQAKITGMSQRARGAADGPAGESVVSNLSGRFRLQNGVLSMANLVFAVPGAAVTLHGSYGLRNEAVLFDGTLRMQATISEAAGGGVKSVLLKAVDPLFRQGKTGTVLPIKIRGTRSDPKFGLDVKRVITGK